nr:MAG TPA: hypothetical protein [Caudoviricetes sp.]
MGAAPDDDKLSAASYIAVGVRCGLSIQETLQYPVGVITDLWEIYKQSHGLSDNSEA